LQRGNLEAVQLQGLMEFDQDRRQRSQRSSQPFMRRTL
jgi:hypothetical protein